MIACSSVPVWRNSAARLLYGCKLNGHQGKDTGTAPRQEGSRAPGGAAARRLRRRRRSRARRHQRLPHAQRCDPVADHGDLSDAEVGAFARFQPDRPHHLHLPGHGIAVAAIRRATTPTAIPTPYSLALGMGSSLVGLLLHVVRRQPFAMCCSPRPWSAWDPRCSTRNPRGWRGLRRAGGTAWRNRYSRSAAISARPSARCSRPSSCCRSDRRASPGSRSWR